MWVQTKGAMFLIAHLDANRKYLEMVAQSHICDGIFSFWSQTWMSLLCSKTNTIDLAFSKLLEGTVSRNEVPLYYIYKSLPNRPICHGKKGLIDPVTAKFTETQHSLYIYQSL